MPISLKTAGAKYEQDFNSLAASGTSSTLPEGWALSETGTSATVNSSYAAGTGSSNSGDTYSFGTSAADRAFGTLQSGTNLPTIGAQFTNDTGDALKAVLISFTGEQWRLGATGRADRLDFQISFDATSLTTGTWTNVDQLDFSSPITTGPLGAFDGNAAANRTAVSHQIDGLNIPAGATFWIRWLDVNASGADDGLAIDDFALTPIAADTPPAQSVSDAAVAEAAGGSVAVFTVTLSKPSTQTVTVGFTTQDGNALAGSDYALTQGTITFLPGETSKTIEVPVIDDALVEGPETFTVVLSGAVNAIIADASGTGTIASDDPPPVVRPGVLSIDSVAVAEGDSGNTAMTFTVTRANGSDGAVAANYAITFGSADAADLAGGTPLTGTVSFADGQASATITVQVSGDLAVEGDETFDIALSNATGGATIGGANGTGTILNDDQAAPGTVRIFSETFGTFTGAGFAVNPGAGQLDSDVWRVGGLSDGPNPAYGFTGTTGDFARGTINGSADPASGGVYSPSANRALVVQPTGSDFDAGGFIESRIANTSGATATSFEVSFDWAFRNSGDRVSNLTLSYSTDGFTFTEVPAAGFATPATRDPATAAAFSVSRETVTLNNVIVPNGEFLYLRWTHLGSTGGGNRDEVGIDNLIVDATTTNDPLLIVGAPRVVEGNAGVAQAVFTFTRTSPTGTASVDFATADGTAFAGRDYVAKQGTVFFAEGQTSATVTVDIIGDTRFEADESFALALSNGTGFLVPQAKATAAILNDDANLVTIGEIQGEAHRSPVEGLAVVTNGIVTAVRSNGFYLQDGGDGDARTSDGVFVFTGSAPAVALGDAVQVRGTVAEFLPAGSARNLTTTQLTASNVTVTSSGNALPAAVLIGTGGILAPTDTIDDDGLTSYDPATDGIDFYEALEGMRVTVDAPRVIHNSSGDTVQVVASDGVGVTGLNARGGLTISDGDFNPERIKLFDADGRIAKPADGFTQGDRLSDVTGIVSYFGNDRADGMYELLVTEAASVTTDASPLTGEVTNLIGDRNHLTVATFNVENLDINDDASKFEILAQNIVVNLRTPDIIGVQEMQDANGFGGSDPLSAQPTADKLIAAIKAINPNLNYIYVEVAPATPNSTGGEAGGNIRNGFLYNADRVGYIGGSAGIIEAGAFAGSRKPLFADFTFNGETIRLVNVHSSARIGSDPLFGASQPPENAADGSRIAQSQAVLNYVNSALATNPGLHFGVLGDFNGFYFEESLTLFEAGGVFTNLHRLNPEEERYSYLYDGNYQAIDHVLVTGGLAQRAQFDSVHINAELPRGVFRGTDHDPQVARLFIEAPNEAPTNLAIDDAAVDENAPAGTLVGTLSADDIDEDVLSYQLLDDAGGLFDLDAATGALTTTAPLNHEAQASYTIVAEAVDPDGARVARTFTISVADVNEAPVASADAVAINEDGTTGNLWNVLLGNDSDPDAGASLSIGSVDTGGTLGSVLFDPATQTLRYVADHDSFDQLPAGATIVDRFTYTVTDQNGLTSTATVEVTVTGIADGIRVDAGNGNDNVLGTGGEDQLAGGNGNDVVRGGDGHDRLEGGNGTDSLFGEGGNDWLRGGNGNDLLAGGAGRDLFQFAKGGGTDTIIDFDTALDRIVLDGVAVKSHQIGDVNGDGVKDLTIAFTNGGGAAVLLGVGSLAGVQFVEAGAVGVAYYQPQDDLGFQQATFIA